MPLAELPQSNKQHAVPQNIMDVEFKLIGDLTMRQFAYLVVFGGMSYFSSVVIIGVFKYPLVILNALIGFGLAFIPIQERGLDEWIANFLKAVYSPTQRIWKKDLTIPSAFLYENLNVVKQEMIALAPTSSRRKLEEYLHYQAAETAVDPLDIPEAEYAQKVRDAFAYSTPAPAAPSMPSTPSVSIGLEPELPTMPEQPSFVEQPQSPEEHKEGEQPTEQPVQQSGESGMPSAPVTQAPVQTVAPQPVQQPQPVAPQPQPQSEIQIQHQQRPTNAMAFAPITPDMHAGRRFTNLLPDGGEIILPIRGEKVLITSDEEGIEDDIQEKAEKLKKLLSQIKGGTEGVVVPAAQQPQAQAPAPVVQEAPAEEAAEAETIVENLKHENETLEEEITRLKSEPTTNQDAETIRKKEERIKMLEAQKQKTQGDYAKLQQQVLDLQNKLKQKEVVAAPTSLKPMYAKMQPITNAPNVVTGIVKKPDGGILEGVLLIIKNDKGEAVRAFKTNSIGQFALTTALANGMYTLEVSDTKGISLAFDIISLEAKGEVIPPIEIVGREPTL